MEQPMNSATEHHSMNVIIHAAFRRDLHRFDAALRAWSDGSETRARETATAWDNFAVQLHHHHADEETIFFPVLRTLGASDSLADELEAEHARMVVALEHADESMKRFRASPSTSTAMAARAAIAELAAVSTIHLVHEEREMEPIAASNSAKPEMKAAQKAVRRAHRGNTGTFFAWLLDGADAETVKGLRREVPRPVLFVVTRTGGRRYRRTVAPVWA
jgi:hypothetical protein